MKKFKVIHQFTPTISYGDSLSNALIYTQKLLNSLGYISKIYAVNSVIDIRMKHEIYHIDEYNSSANQILFYHHSIGHNYHDEIMKFYDKKILIYHNITPAYFFKNNERIQEFCNLGREQLKKSSNFFIASLGDSDYNSKELRYYQYQNIKTLPLLLDFNKHLKYKADEQLIKKYSEVYNIIFVGRVVQNKVQHQLIDVMLQLKNKGLKKFKLHIIGGTSQIDYLDFLKLYIKKLNLLVEVTITGKVSDKILSSYYTLADLYLSLSEHEGFGIPLVEAMKYDVPVLAFNAGGISTTIPKEGLLEKKAPSFVADKILKFLNDPYLRVELIKKQKQHIKQFSNINIKKKLIDLLNSLDIESNLVDTKEESLAKNTNYQIEGPFDSTYSLSIVNQTTAKALSYMKETKVKLYSTEGTGDFQANLSIVDTEIKKLAQTKLEHIDITLRNLYPPRTNAMQGYHKIIGPYGWEESKFPQKYVDMFNTRLTMIFTMSDYVKNILIDNGITTPIKTTGIVVEDILKIKSQPFSFTLPSDFKILHISSAFARKGVDKLLEAFELLDNSKEISLIIKTFPNPHNNVVELLDDNGFKLDEVYEKNISLYLKSSKKILLINKDIPQAQIKYLYKNSNVLVAPSFGEGFGLPMAEAMLLDVPVITTGFGGQSDFCTNDTAWLIEFDFTYSKTHMNLENSLWQVPKQEHLSSLIEEIYSLSKDEIKIKTQKAKDFILKNYSGKSVALKIKDSIKNYPKFKKKQNIAMISTYNTKCGIADYSKYLVSEFEDEITILAPLTTQQLILKDSLNIIRCWDYGKKLQNIENIKKIIVDKKITQLIIQYNFGFFSLDILKSLIYLCIEDNISIYLFLHSTSDVIIENTLVSLQQIKNALQKVTTIYMHSLIDKNYLKDMGIYKNTHLFTHGIDFSLVKNIDIKRSKDIVLATFGYLLPQKGVLELIDILELLHQKGCKVKLLLLTAIYPAPVSRELEKKVKEKIANSSIRKYIIFDTSFYTHEEIVLKLVQATKIVFYYTSTQESSSASVRMGLLAQKEVITNPNIIFDDVKSIITQSKKNSINSMAEIIIKSLQTPYNTNKHRKFLEQNSWKNISEKFKKLLT